MVKKVTEVAEDAILESAGTSPSQDGIFTAQNGIQFQLKKVSRLIMVDALQKLEVPKAPTVFLEEKGRTEENPNDPDYIAALDMHRFKRSTLAIEIYFALGTAVIFLPDGIQDPASIEWADEVKEFTNLEIPDSGRRRYLSWMKYYALVDEDQGDLLSAVIAFSGGVTNNEVEQAGESFRDISSRDTD